MYFNAHVMKSEILIIAYSEVNFIYLHFILVVLYVYVYGDVKGIVNLDWVDLETGTTMEKFNYVHFFKAKVFHDSIRRSSCRS